MNICRTIELNTTWFDLANLSNMKELIKLETQSPSEDNALYILSSCYNQGYNKREQTIFEKMIDFTCEAGALLRQLSYSLLCDMMLYVYRLFIGFVHSCESRKRSNISLLLHFCGISSAFQTSPIRCEINGSSSIAREI